jgi:hypothetical protein
MSLFKLSASLFLCLVLLTGNMANAASACCMGNSSMPAATADMPVDHENMDMPCHDMEMTQQDTDQHSDCGGCDCQHCFKMSALPTPLPQTATPAHFNDYVIFSGTAPQQPSDIFQPPKHHS